MAQANQLQPPIDAGVEIETIGFDFGAALAAGVTILESPAPIVSCAVYSGNDPAPASRIVSVPVIVASKVTGALDAAVSVQIGNMLADVMYRVDCAVNTSDGQTLNLYTHIACAAVT